MSMKVWKTVLVLHAASTVVLCKGGGGGASSTSSSGSYAGASGGAAGGATYSATGKTTGTSWSTSGTTRTSAGSRITYVNNKPYSSRPRYYNQGYSRTSGPRHITPRTGARNKPSATSACPRAHTGIPAPGCAAPCPGVSMSRFSCFV
jgi:hypothetical protein